MIKIIFHISDLHIRNFQYHDQYRKILTHMMEEFRSISSKKKVSKEEVRIVIAGDLFHQKINVSNEQILFTAWLLKKLTSIGKVIIIPGNHDFLEKNHERVDSITPIINLIANDNVFYYRESGVFDDENISWVVFSLYNHNKKPSFEKSKNKYIGIFHGPIKGLKTDIGFEFEDGYDANLFEGCDLVLCGDIHKRQIIDYPGGKAYMIGSTIQQSFGETVKNHGFGWYDVEKNIYRCVDLKNDTPFLKFKITDITDIENGKEQLLNFE